jgi:hypothetical protein
MGTLTVQVPSRGCSRPEVRSRKKLLWLLLPLGGVLVILLACGAAPNTVATAPASTMSLSIWIDNQLIPDSTGTTVSIYVTFSNASVGFALSGKQTLTCNGVKLPSGAVRWSVPRQPPGGVYTFVYTDERGYQTTLIVPVPRGTFQVLSPMPNAAVPIPMHTRYTPPASATPGPRPPESVNALSIHYLFPLLPQNATATMSAYASSSNGNVFGAEEPATGTYLLSDAGTPYGQGFEAFPPGPGVITLKASIDWKPPASGFHTVQVVYRANLAYPITWTKA